MSIQVELEKSRSYIVGQYNKGVSTNKLAEEFNCNSGTIYYYLKNIGIELRKKSNFKGKVEDYKNEIIEKFNSGLSCYRISKDLGISKPAVIRNLKKWGFDTSKKSKVDPNNLLKDKLDQVIKLYDSGMTIHAISVKLGHHNDHVKKLLEKNNIEIRDDRYTVDETFFDVIDSEAKAYVLGWFYSDGSVDTEGKMRITIQAEDKAVLEVIKKLMGYDGPLYEIAPPKKFPHRKAQVSLSINRKTLADKLIELGCTPNKSLTVEMPTKDQVPPAFFNHFIRGVYDGDGSINIKKEKYVQCSITSTDIFLQPLRNHLLKRHGIETKHYYRYDYTNTMSMMTTKTDYSIRFLEWIYQGSSVYLTRKKQIFDDYLESVYNTM
jgi:intein-encoded DNA endonuclease-like protein